MHDIPINAEASERDDLMQRIEALRGHHVVTDLEEATVEELRVIVNWLSSRECKVFCVSGHRVNFLHGGNPWPRNLTRPIESSTS
jgi:hypothetical protein